MEFELKDEYITLAQLLKACDVVYSGGQAKEYLANMEVLVNGVNENRRGKKIRQGTISAQRRETYTTSIKKRE